MELNEKNISMRRKVGGIKVTQNLEYIAQREIHGRICTKHARATLANEDPKMF
jgi:hypothetical protein